MLIGKRRVGINSLALKLVVPPFLCSWVGALRRIKKILIELLSEGYLGCRRYLLIEPY